MRTGVTALFVSLDGKSDAFYGDADSPSLSGITVK